MTTRRALAFSFLDRYASLVLSIISSMIIARLLSPAELGVFSVTMVLISFVSSLRDLGAGQYLLQEADLTPERQRATWTVLLGMGCALALLVLAAAYPVSRFYAEPAMISIMVLIAVNFAVNPFGSLTYAWLMREMRFDVLAMMRFGGSVAGASISVTLAWLEFGAISLAWGSLAGTVVNALIGLGYRPTHFRWLPGLKEVRRVLKFGSRISASTLVSDVGNGAPELALGKLHSLADAGLYSRGNGLSAMFHRLVLDATTAVALPLFAKALREQGSSVEPWLRAVSYVCALGWTFLGGVALLCWPLMRTLYGDQWDGAVLPAQIICVAMAVSLPAVLCPQLLIGNGQSGRLLKAMLATTAVQIAAVVCGAWFGLAQTAVGYLVSQVFMVASWLTASHSAVQFRWYALAAVLWNSAKVATLTLAVPLVAILVLGARPAAPLAVLLGVFVLGAFAFFGALRWTAHPLLVEAEALVSRLPLRRGAV